MLYQLVWCEGWPLELPQKTDSKWNKHKSLYTCSRHQEAIMSLQDWWTRTTNISFFHLCYACLVNLDDFKEGTAKGSKKIQWDTFSGHVLKTRCCACWHNATLVPDSPTQSQEKLKVHDVALGHSCRFFLFALKSSFLLLVTMTMIISRIKGIYLGLC